MRLIMFHVTNLDSIKQQQRTRTLSTTTTLPSLLSVGGGVVEYTDCISAEG